MTENLTKEDVLLLIVFTSVIGQAYSYNIGHFTAQKLGLTKPDQSTYRQPYELAKNQIELIKQTNLREYVPKLELFMKEFERNESK